MSSPPDVTLVPGGVLRGRPVRPYDAFPILVGPLPVSVGSVQGAPDTLSQAAEGLPSGPATAEALAVRLRRAGVALTVTPPVGEGAACVAELVRTERDRGRAAVDVWRAAPELLPELRIGAWTAARTSARALRVLLRPVVAVAARVLDRRGADADATAVRAVADAAFWAGVRARTSTREWQVLSASYVCFCYHRVAGEFLPGQEVLDLAPARLRQQARLLRALGWRPLTGDELLDWHAQRPVRVRRRRYLLTFDDGFPDALQACRTHARHRPHAYIPTAATGGIADWVSGGTPVADWDLVRSTRTAGVEIGGHGRRHRALDGMPEAELLDEVEGSYGDVLREVPSALPVLAYPYGRHDAAARAAARRGGYRLAWTTAVGRNGAGTDPWCLRRAGVVQSDSLPAFLWKAVTGEQLPRSWQHRLDRRAARYGFPALGPEG